MTIIIRKATEVRKGDVVVVYTHDDEHGTSSSHQAVAGVHQNLNGSLVFYFVGGFTLGPVNKNTEIEVVI